MHRSICSAILVLALCFCLYGVYGCSKGDDTKSDAGKPSGQPPVAAASGDIETLKNIYLNCMEGFEYNACGSADRLSANRSRVSDALSALNGLKTSDPRTGELQAKFADLLNQYSDTAGQLIDTLESNKRDREDRARRQEEEKRQEQEKRTAGEPYKPDWNKFSQKVDDTRQNSEKYDYKNLGSKQDTIKSLEQSLYFLRKDMGIPNTPQHK